MAVRSDQWDTVPQRGLTGAGPLLCVSALEPGMGVDVLLAAVGLLSHDRPHLRLEIVGDGSLAAGLREQARALGLEQRVRFREPLSKTDLRTMLRRCSMLVLPCSIEDPAGRSAASEVLVESMAVGTPVVTTDVIGLPNMVRSDTTGVLVAARDAAGLAVTVAGLLDDPARAARIGAAGHRLIARRRARKIPPGRATSDPRQES